MNIFQRQLLFSDGKTQAEHARQEGWREVGEELPPQPVSVEEFLRTMRSVATRGEARPVELPGVEVLPADERIHWE